ncbi:hypothetical protein LTR70_005958 [Exophiala xenobiotica]|uniref:Heterokaryon incompatibility domain-containing protein n=1 Tax=Lithohypha guttulata TaxID=1690604 RepID=A0ABR0K7K5_9EURO|nr:hypothetical protein LTR24_006180 [Lithohypha guttulata]KAK5317218.1 hypothetical protein LTR70_005958 [Exophiala xenobiotica]
MRLLRLSSQNEFSLTGDLTDIVPPYAILSHTWGSDDDEVTFADLQERRGHSKAGYAKLRFCAERARSDGVGYFWVDTCCINKANHSELSEAIVSMFRLYHDAAKCYVYLSDVSTRTLDHEGGTRYVWEPSFRTSRWFTRGWTLQELLAPKVVKFFSREKELLGDRKVLAQLIHDITTIPVNALCGTPLPEFLIMERMQWAERRNTKKKEDKAYCLLGIFGVSMPVIYGEGEKAFRRLQKKIEEQSGPSAKPGHVHWIMPRTANPLFTGRQDLLKELEHIVRDAVHCPWGRSQCRIVISGIGGQGKSEICLQLARRLRQLFWVVLWVDLSNPDVAESSFLEAAHKLSISAQSLEDAHHGIANLKHPWLLVLDNADDPDVDYQNYFPDGRLGVVMMTTRNDDCEGYGTDKSIVLPGLDDYDARDLLLKAARVGSGHHNVHDEDAMVVARLLQSHPLALIQAGAYVSRGQCSLAEYPRKYERQRRRLLTYRPVQARSRYGDVYATFEVSAEILSATTTQAAQDALQLLPLLAVCGSSRFPLSMFETAYQGAKDVPPGLDDSAEDIEVDLLTPWHVARLPPFLDNTSDDWDSFRLMEAVALLKAFSLISTEVYDSFLFVSTHALINAWARDRQDDSEQHQTWLQMSCTMALALASETLSQENNRQLQPHVEELTDWEATTMFTAEPSMLVARNLVWCGWYLGAKRADTKLFVLMQRVFTHLGLNWHRVEQSWIGLYDLAARNLMAHGKIREAVELQQAIVKIRERIQAEDHPDRLKSQRALAIAYADNGQGREVAALLEEVVKIQTQSLVDDHPERLVSQHQLAIAYQANGQVKEAIRMLEEVVKMREQSVAEDHPERLSSQHELAGAYQANGQVKEAVRILEEVVKIREQSVAEDHPDRLASQYELARAYRANGQVKETVRMLREVVKIEEQSLAEDHPDTRERETALSIITQVVKIREQLLAEDHPDRLGSQHNLAFYLWETGEHKTALSMMTQVVKIREQSLAEDHLDRLSSQLCLATYLWATGERETALSMITQVVKILEQSLAEGHPHRQRSKEWLAYLQEEMAEDGMAEEEMAEEEMAEEEMAEDGMAEHETAEQEIAELNIN